MIFCAMRSDSWCEPARPAAMEPNGGRGPEVCRRVGPEYGITNYAIGHGIWNNEKNAPQTLSDLIRGLQYSVNTAMEMIETRNVELLGRYFSPQGEPLTKRLNINDTTAVEVPLISIVNPSAINIKEVEMDFSVRIVFSEVRRKCPQEGFAAGDRAAQFDNRLKRSNLEISFDGSKEASRMQVHIKFESKPIPEGLARIIDEYDKTIMPFTVQDGNGS